MAWTDLDPSLLKNKILVPWISFTSIQLIQVESNLNIHTFF